MSDFELLRDSLLMVRFEKDLSCVDQDLEKNKPTVAEEGKKLNIFKKMGNSIKDSKTESLNKDKEVIVNEKERFTRAHNKVLTGEEITKKANELFKDDKEGFKKSLFNVLATSNDGYKFIYETEGLEEISKLLDIKSNELSKIKSEIIDTYRDLTKDGILSGGIKFDEACEQLLSNAILEILNEQRSLFVSKFVIDSGVYKLEKAISKYAVDQSKFKGNELAIAYAIIIVLLRKRKTIDSKEVRKESLTNIVNQESALLEDIHLNYLVENFNDKDAKLKYLILRNFEEVLVKEFCE